jgi:putative MATE family efflux protein
MQISSEKGLYKRVLLLAAPMALQNIITFSVGLADNLMVGSLGELALSGVYISNQLQNILQMLVLGLGAALAVLATQYWGKKDRDSIKLIIGIALKFSLGAGLLFFTATLFFPEQILRLFTNEQAVIPEAMKYMTIIRFTYVFFCITQVLIASMRCVERVKIGMYLSIVTFFVNVSLNWILIFGKLGAPALGIRGAAIATLTARIAETIIMVLYVRVFDDRLRLKFKDLLKTNLPLLKDFFKYGLPVIMGDIFWGINIAVQGAIIGRLGSTALASVSISNIVFSMLAVGAYGTAGASAVIIGQTVGSGDYDKVKLYAKKLQILFLIVGVISGLALFIAKDYILMMYNLSEDTIIMAAQLLTVLSITMVGTSYQMSSLTGIVRAGGSIYFVLVNDLIFVWLVVIPSALIAAFVFQASPVVVFACLKSDQILKCFVAVVKVNNFRWMKNLTRETSGAVKA